MWPLLFIIATAWAYDIADLPPSCSREVYCESNVLHYVQLARIFNDSKTFVDLELVYEPAKVLADFDQLLEETDQNPSREQIQQFVDEYFTDIGELEEWIPTDFSDDPEFLQHVKDEQLRKFGEDINSIWPIISRKVKDEVFDRPEKTSLVPLTNGFMIPGGRFKEIYYWDTFWIVEGLLISGMKETAKGVILNLIELLNLFGHIPNGSRWYYEKRSQPPLLSDMVAIYYEYTEDIQLLRDNIQYLEAEVDYWLNEKMVSVEKDGQTYNLLRYYTPSRGPRPESYREDYEDSEHMNETRRAEFYIDIKAAAESGWDFSSRWFVSADGNNRGSLTDIHTTHIIPVDLNSIFTGILKNFANFNAILGNTRKAARYGELADQWRRNIHAVLWNEEEGIWFDYDFKQQVHRKFFYPSNFAPLWQGAVTEELVQQNGPRVVKYLEESGALKFPGGVPSSLERSGEQWDFPNVWPPLTSIVVGALEAINTEDASKLALEVAQTYVRACRKGFEEHGQMFEKYDAENHGQYGGGGEYTVQLGFGWSNGVVLEFLSKYGSVMTADDGPGSSKNLYRK